MINLKIGGIQVGDPAKLAQALIRIANENQPPHRFIPGADAIGVEQEIAIEKKTKLATMTDDFTMN